MDFACDPAAPTAALDLLATFGTARNTPLWLLVDAALIDGVRLRALVSSLGWEASNALQGSPLESYGAQAPHLVVLPADIDSAAIGLQRLIALDTRAPAFSLIESPSPRADLSRLCAYLSQARVDGDLLVHCRFADTRVLPHLLHTLSAAQASRVSADVSAWSWNDHLGRVSSWRSGTGATTASSADIAPHLELDKMQFGAMLDASEPDTMFSLLLDNTPEVVPPANRGQFREHLSQILGRASMRCLTSPNDRLQFTILSLTCGDAFHEHPELQTTWEAIALHGATLVEQMKAWSDELWERLQRREGTIAK